MNKQVSKHMDSNIQGKLANHFRGISMGNYTTNDPKNLQDTARSAPNHIAGLETPIKSQGSA